MRDSSTCSFVTESSGLTKINWQKLHSQKKTTFKISYSWQLCRAWGCQIWSAKKHKMSKLARWVTRERTPCRSVSGRRAVAAARQSRLRRSRGRPGQPARRWSRRAARTTCRAWTPRRRAASDSTTSPAARAVAAPAARPWPGRPGTAPLPAPASPPRRASKSTFYPVFSTLPWSTFIHRLIFINGQELFKKLSIDKMQMYLKFQCSKLETFIRPQIFPKALNT